MERHDCIELQVLPLHFPRRTEETHRNSQDNVLRADFEPGISRTRRIVSLCPFVTIFASSPQVVFVECLVCYVKFTV